MSSRPAEISLVLAMVLLPVTALAQPEERDQAESPSLELLEFLGFWETPGGELIDPLNLVRPEDVPGVEDGAREDEKEKVKSHE